MNKTMNTTSRKIKRQRTGGADGDCEDDDMMEENNHRNSAGGLGSVKMLSCSLINPSKYIDTKFIGRGETLSNLKQIAVTGETS